MVGILLLFFKKRLINNLITETRDAYGRSTGYTYTKNEVVQQTVITGYGTDGRIATAGFLHSGAEKQFGYSYLTGSNLLQTLTMPCNMTLTHSYEEKRDLLTGMTYRRGATGVAERAYTYDTLGRPLTRRTARKGTTVNDTFTYSNRSELTEAMVNGGAYSYAYDNIGNRTSVQEAAEEATAYSANALNQYTAIQQGTEEAFVPTYDADGNQTLVKTSTGIWTVAYNAENRPITFTNNESNTVVECAYDYRGRRATKKITNNGETTLHQRYIYRGYLQIACCDLTRANHPCLWLITWDPTQPIATRPLAIQKSGTWYCYGWDLTKNICEVFGSNGYIHTIYTYTPYGEVTSSGSTTQPLQWSSEFYDEELGMTYYNFRYYNPYIGRWVNRDIINENGFYNSYRHSNDGYSIDYLGLFCKKSKKSEHNKLSAISSFELTFKHAALDDMNITIKDSISILKDKLDQYINDEIDLMWDQQCPEIKKIRELISSAMGMYETLKKKVLFSLSLTTSTGTLYDEVQVKVTALRCCCKNCKKKDKKTKKLVNTYCCKAHQVEGNGTRDIFLDLRGAIVRGVLDPQKIGKKVINDTVRAAFNAMKDAADDLRNNTECDTNIK